MRRLEKPHRYPYHRYPYHRYPFSLGQSRFLEAPIIWQADGELKKSLCNGVSKPLGWTVLKIDVNVSFGWRVILKNAPSNLSGCLKVPFPNPIKIGCCHV